MILIGILFLCGVVNSQLVVPGEETLFQLVHDGIVREFFLFVPVNYSFVDPIPLVYSFHGAGG